MPFKVINLYPYLHLTAEMGVIRYLPLYITMDSVKLKVIITCVAVNDTNELCYSSLYPLSFIRVISDQHYPQPLDRYESTPICSMFGIKSVTGSIAFNNIIRTDPGLHCGH